MFFCFRDRTLMLRHGHLSPHSKLLPRPDHPPDTRPGSMCTLACEPALADSALHVTDVFLFLLGAASKAIKDERDTPKRRNRHRDQRLLRGGIGLTTGLGWSDRCVWSLCLLFVC